MRSRAMWNRRQVLQGAGGLAAMGLLAHRASALRVKAQRPRFAYVGSMEDGGLIHAFAIEDRLWTRIQTSVSARPSALTLHPGGGVLYVANEIDTFQGLPCGSIEAYAIDADHGTLTRISQQALSMSGIRPRGLAVSPHGLHAVVAVYGGGAYNVLPIGADGSLGRVSSIVKELGSGPHPEHQLAAHPHTVAFEGAGCFVFGTDTGSDRLSIFRLGQNKLERVSQTRLLVGSGPGSFAVHPAGHLLFVVNHLRSTVCSYACNLREGSVGRELHVAMIETSQQPDLLHPMVIHPTGQFLYTASAGVSAWKIDVDTGLFAPMQLASDGPQSVSALTISPAGDALYALDEAAGEVSQFSINALNGRLGVARSVASIPMARSLAMTYSEG